MEINEQLIQRYQALVDRLLSEKNEEGFWTGRLSSSALSTAVAIVTLKLNNIPDHQQQISRGLKWLLENINEDGGFGDTPDSISNVSTSLLSYAAITYCGTGEDNERKVLTGLENYLLRQDINLHPDSITSSVLHFYGKDYTFSVPILSMLVICGILEEKSCSKIPQLPFELVRFPSSWYSFFNLRVVSYALPALIGMGIFIFKKRKHHNPFMRIIRENSIASALDKLARIVPESGGFLEATPLTGFVSMCLISSGYGNHPVVERGIDFLLDQERHDGSWPIDTDLSTWVTTLSIKALSPDTDLFLNDKQIEKLNNHLLSIQYKETHSFNNARPGGWGWTNYSGSVPDVDDTCGAILALLQLTRNKDPQSMALINGCNWLLEQQNRDGGFPTFCKGWGKLPFDSSCSDLTGHAFCALMSTLEKPGINLSEKFRKKIYRNAIRGFDFLKKEQKENGSWLPLWFGNQYTKDKTNPVYGTAKVIIYLSDVINFDCIEAGYKGKMNDLLVKAKNFLLSQQNEDGSWGGAIGTPGSLEETALAISALGREYAVQCYAGFQWMESKFEFEGLPSAPIGLYFAALWYNEKLYPLIYYVEALRRFLK